MDTFGHEVAVKIKSAIKAKLMELNSYVDDELPDYIMVMVANKKTKAQMSGDLALFLGENAEKFCDWLDDVLKRIQAVTLETQRKAESERLNLQAREKDALKIQSEEANYKNVLEKIEQDAQDEILAIKAEADDLLSDELMKDEISKTESSSQITTQTSSSTPVATSRREELVEEPRAKIARISITTTSSADSSSSKDTITSEKQPALLSPSGENRKRKIPSSAVGAVLKRDFPQEEEDEEEYDPRHPSIGAVASIVQVSKRRPTLPPEKQANSTLLFKAVNEAQKSVLQIRSSIKSDNSGPTKLFTKSYLERQKLQQEKKIEAKSENVVVRRENFTLLSEADSNNGLDNDDNVDNKVEPIKFSTNRVVMFPDRVDKRSGSPEFIITLDGVDKGTFNAETTEEEEIEMTVQESDAEMLPDDDVFMSVGEEEAAMENDKEEVRENSNVRCKYWPVCKNGDQCAYHHPTILCKTFPACKFGNQCLYIHPNCKFDATCGRPDCPYTHVSQRNTFDSGAKLKTSSVNLSTRNSALHPSKVTCRNFPQCKNVDCPFLHPKSCRYGVGCTRSDCVFFHPAFPAPDKMKWKAKNGNPSTTQLQITPESVTSTKS
ncbi:hypothetical protein CHUAL_008151 [Chamberlinius hualienensis]